MGRTQLRTMAPCVQQNSLLTGIMRPTIKAPESSAAGDPGGAEVRRMIVVATPRPTAREGCVGVGPGSKRWPDAASVQPSPRGVGRGCAGRDGDREARRERLRTCRQDPHVSAGHGHCEGHVLSQANRTQGHRNGI